MSCPKSAEFRQLQAMRRYIPGACLCLSFSVQSITRPRASAAVAPTSDLIYVVEGITQELGALGQLRDLQIDGAGPPQNQYTKAIS